MTRVERVAEQLRGGRWGRAEEEKEEEEEEEDEVGHGWTRSRQAAGDSRVLIGSRK